MDKITYINDKIEKLKKQKTKVQTQEAILFRREAEKLFENDFKPELALAVMSDWNTAPEAKKKEWTNKSHSFRRTSIQSAERTTEIPDATTHKNRKTSTTENG